MRFSTTTVSLFLTIANALTITSPSSGASLDPTQPITIEWTSSSSDPSTFNLILDNSNSNSLIKNKVVATSVSTSSGSYILSTATLMTYGSGFIFKAEDASGTVLSTSGSFSLAVANGAASSTSNGQASFHSTYTATDASGATSSTSGSDESSTGSFYAQTTGTDRTTTITGTATETTSSTNGFLTSTMTRSASSSSSSGTRSGASSAASATTSANAQPRLGGSSSQIAFSAAGILAGLVALLA